MDGTRTTTTTTSGSDSESELWKERQKVLLANQIQNIEMYKNEHHKNDAKALFYRTRSTATISRNTEGPDFGIYVHSGKLNFRKKYNLRYNSLKLRQKPKKRRGDSGGTLMNRSRSEADVMANISTLVHSGDCIYSSSSSETENSRYALSTSNEIFQSVNSSTNLDDDFTIQEFVVVYIGAVPVRDYWSNLPRRIIRSSLQNLRLQRAKARTVLLEISKRQLIVTNSKNVIINRFKINSLLVVQHCVENPQFFALLVLCPTAVVCHVFAIDLELCSHRAHLKYARKFNVACKGSGRTGGCVQFPFTSSPVLTKLYQVVPAEKYQQSICPSGKERVDYGSNSYRRKVIERQRQHHRSRQRRRLYPNVSAEVAHVVRKSVTSSNRGRQPDNEIKGFSQDDVTISSITTDDRYETSISEVTTVESSSTNPSMSSGSVNMANQYAKHFMEDLHPVMPAIQSQGTTTRVRYGSRQINIGYACNYNNNNYDNFNNNVKRVTFIDDGIAPGDRKSVSQKENLNVPKLSILAAGSPSGLSSRSEERVLPSKQRHGSRTGLMAQDAHMTFAPGTATIFTEQKSVSYEDNVTASLGKSQSSAIDNEGMDTRRAWSCYSNSAADLHKFENFRISRSTESSAVPHSSSVTNVKASNASVLPMSTHLARRGFFKHSTINHPIDKSSSLPKMSISFPLEQKAALGKQPPQNAGSGGSLLKRFTRAETRFSLRIKQAQKKRLELWASDFESLLRDPAGLLAFSAYLRKQYCLENLTFWIACENFKLLEEQRLRDEANKLYAKHVEAGCPEPINVDSTAKQQIDEAVVGERYEKTMFDVAQAQIFYLMRYDCYPRFLKSDEYSRCWMQAVDKIGPLQSADEPFLKNFYSCEEHDYLNKRFGGSTASLTRSIDEDRINKGRDDKNKHRKSLLPWKSNFVGRINGGGSNLKGAADNKSIEYCNDPVHQSISEYCIQSKSIKDQAKSVENGNGCWTTSCGRNGGELARKEIWLGGTPCPLPAQTSLSALNPNNSAQAPPDVVPQPDPPSSPRASADRSAEYFIIPIASLEGENKENASTTPSCIVVLGSKERFRVQIPECHSEVTVKDWLRDIGPHLKLNAASTDVLLLHSNEKVDLAAFAFNSLNNCTVLLENSVLFKVEIPVYTNSRHKGIQRKLICVKAACESTSAQALRPILSKYGLNLDNMIVTVHGSNEVLPNHASIDRANNKKLVVLTQREFQDWVHRDAYELNKAQELIKKSGQCELPCIEECTSCDSASNALPSKKSIFGLKTSLGGGMLKFVRRHAKAQQDEKSLIRKGASAFLKGHKSVESVSDKRINYVAAGRQSFSAPLPCTVNGDLSDAESRGRKILAREQTPAGNERDTIALSRRSASLAAVSSFAQNQNLEELAHLRNIKITECRRFFGSLTDADDDDDDLDKENDDDWLLGNAVRGDVDLMADGGVIPSLDDAERLFGGVVVKVDSDIFREPSDEYNNPDDSLVALSIGNKKDGKNSLGIKSACSCEREYSTDILDDSTNSAGCSIKSNRIASEQPIHTVQDSFADCSVRESNSISYTDNGHEWHIDFV